MKILIKKNGVHHVLEIAEHWIHIVYCGVVFLEAHGTYGYVAGGLGVIAFFHLVTNAKTGQCEINCDLS